MNLPPETQPDLPLIHLAVRTGSHLPGFPPGDGRAWACALSHGSWLSRVPSCWRCQALTGRAQALTCQRFPIPGDFLLQREGALETPPCL